MSLCIHSEPSMETDEDSWLIDDPNLDFMMDEIMWQDRIVSGWPDMPKNSEYKPTLQMWLKLLIQGVGFCIYK